MALQERNDTLRKLSEEQSARILQDEILENHLSKQKEMEISKAKMSSENSGLVEKMEVESSKYGHLHQENELLRHELLSMTNVQKKCGTLEKDKKKLEEEIVKLKSHMAKNMLELSQMEQYKQMIEDGTKQELEEKLTEVNLFLQKQAACQEKIEQLNASSKKHTEDRINELETELSEMRCQVDSSKIEREHYKQLYLKEIKIRKSLSNKLSK
ncbi:ankyrin repeat domain-containing protein 26-like [Perognathus longimembris pacificus]|uniref:ankyrin repeat domain-containing protein 26-like n=1 Tax=Perognathus longimembris pacificus TaxID=214514 RepID=UPI0020191053|nr:ankyrin repeat domain-containing protein 26-like [Perognathus longimembris pacificus]